uniref:Reverse transcriptase Ty1/copia-type domain-containing protein n=1 Tax=Vitis vinifera TaxID=29760 RepID=A5B5X7_VITVI|nr:hypothetical protein VITISV_000411 [Vitis vinifera]
MITSEKLVGSENYLSWSASVELWFMGQGYEDHLVTQEADIPEVDRVQWRKIDAQLCSVLWQSVDLKILLHLRAYKTCFKFWTRAKGLYTNDIQRLYKVASVIVHISQQDLDLSTYIGQIASLKEEFLTVMPLTPDVGAQQTQLDKFFMVLTLIGLRPDLEPVRDQILGSSSVPSLDDFLKLALEEAAVVPEVYMEQPPGFVAQGESGLVCRLRSSLYGLKQSPRAWFGRFSSVVQEFGMFRSTSDHSCIYLVVYVDDIVITGSDQDGIQKLKQHLFTHFQTKDLGKLKYFLGIEITQSSSGVVLSQRKYALDILEETGMLDCKPVDTPMDPNVKLVPGQGEPLGDPGRYRRLVGKLNYLTITRPDISFPVSVVSQFLQSPCDSHWDVVIRILRYIKSTPGQGMLYENRGHTQVFGYTDTDWAGSPTNRRSTSGYCVFIGGNLISWKSKKQDVVVRSSAEAEYRAMALATCELIWLRHLLQELRFGKDEQMKLICDNQVTLHIASNPVFHERTKHIEVDCHFIREKIASGSDIFTKSLRGPRIKYICNKLGAYDVYAPACRGSVEYNVFIVYNLSLLI